jgi:hypothetical protein
MKKLFVGTALLGSLIASSAFAQYGNPYSPYPNYTAPRYVPPPPPTSYTTIGPNTFGSDGTTATTIGPNTFINTPGYPQRTCTTIGPNTFCN